ncbi:MAG: DUF3443 family protein [Terriglobia bacterium]|jgi:hypothetical protein
MSARTLSTGTLIRLFAVLMGLAVLAGCGSSSSSNTSTGTPAITLAPTTFTTFSSGVGVASAAQSMTVTDAGTASLTFSSITTSSGFSQTNTCGTGIAAGAACSISVTFTPTAPGTVNGTLTITDNVSGSPQTVTLSGTATGASVSPTSLTFSGVAVGTTSAPQAVTLTNAGTSAITSVSVSTSAPFAQTNNCPASLAASATCTINVTFTPTSTTGASGTLTITDSAGTQTVALTGATNTSNTVAVNVNFGPNGQSGQYYNGIYVTLNVCTPGTSTCVSVPNVLVDTGSVGVRILASALTGVTLPAINDGQGDDLNECTMYGDGSFNWGPVESATVQIGGETASQVPASAGGTASTGIPIQIISTDTVPVAVTDASQCVQSTNTPDEDTVATFGANGLIGIGVEAQDCVYGGVNQCTTASSGDFYWLVDSAGDAEQAGVPVNDQVWNPVAAFSSADINGEVLTLPPIPAAGQATATGTLTFGVNTETNNAIPGTASVYELDDYGYFASSTYNGVTSTSANSGGTFLDAGSDTLFISDETTLGTTDCISSGTDIGLYCPSSTLSISLEVAGTNGTSTTLDLSIANALNLFNANPSFAAYNDLAGPSCIPVTGSPCSAATDVWDLGLPVFFGKTIFFGIGGTTEGGATSGTTSTNGYYAF